MQADERRFGWGPFLQATQRKIPSDREMVEQDGLFGGEVAKDGASTDPGGLGDLIDRGFQVVLADQQLERRLGYAGPGFSGFAIAYRGFSHALRA
jgi:hypothetical protein